MTEDILERLKAKEEEMEAYLDVARREALSIREESVKKARAIRAEGLKSLDEELKKLSQAGSEAAQMEADAIAADAVAAAKELVDRTKGRMEEAVDAVVGVITGGRWQRP